MIRLLLLSFVLTLLVTSLASSAHYIVGMVEDALDSTSPNGRTVVLWNPAIGISDNVTDIVGPSGNSATSSTYLIDCELLNNSCDIDDQLNITLVDNGSGYVAISPVNVTVTGAGFDVAPNISINTPPQITNWTLEDSFTSPSNEIDLTPAANTTVSCTGIVTEYDGIGTLTNYTSELYHVSSSFFGDGDDRNDHYTNTSCFLNTSYGGPNDAFINCSYSLAYFANSQNWTCAVNLTDSTPVSINYSDESYINALLAVGVNTTVDFGTIDADTMSNDTPIEVINYGNVFINLSLSGYAESVGDGNAMACSGGNISVEEMKFNLTDANPGQMNRSDAGQYYVNLTSSPSTNEFNLAFRTNDSTNDARNNTYWRVYVPIGVHSNCNGSLIFGASQT